MGAAGLAAVGGALAGFAVTAVRAFSDLATEVENFRRVAGGTAEDASRLVAVADDVGVSAETLSNGVFQLAKRLESAGDKLATFGVGAARTANGNVDMIETLLRVGDAYKATHDPAQRATLLTAAFGKQGTALIPILERDRTAIEAMFAGAEATGQILTDADLLQAREYRETMDDLADAFRGLAIEGGKALVPFLSDAAKLVGTVTGLIGKVDGLTHKLGQALAGGKKARDDPDSFVNTFRHLVDTIVYGRDVADANLAKVGQAVDETTGAVAEGTDAVDEHAKAVSLVDRAVTSAVNSSRALVQSQRGLADARGDLNDLLKEGAVDTEKVADATRSLASAQRSLGSAQRDQRRAQEEYNTALAAFQEFGGDTNAEKLAEARDKLADADDAVANAQDRVVDSQAELAKAKAGDPDYQEKLADARQRVADAEFAVSQNTLASVKAHDEAAAAIATHGTAAADLLTQYDGLLARAPQVAAALEPLRGMLAPGNTPAFGPPPVNWSGPIGGGGDFGPVTQNINVNVTSPQNADPVTLSRNIAWNLGATKPALN